MDPSNKVENLRRARERWMQQRQAELERLEAHAELTRERGLLERIERDPPRQTLESQSREVSVPAPKTSAERRQGAARGDILPEQLLDRLTERLTLKLKAELREELRKETHNLEFEKEVIEERIERCLQADMESQTCPICYELMVGPTKAPMLLFPCGHTFCLNCLQSHTEVHLKNKCPICRQKIQSQAQNIVLKQLIAKFVQKKQQVLNGQLPSSSISSSESLVRSPTSQEESHPSNVDQYLRDYEMYGVRCRILRNELQDTVEELSKIQDKMECSQLVREHLEQEEQLANLQFQEALKIWEAAKDQLARHDSQLSELRSSLEDAKSKISLLQATLEPLEQEREKTKLLLQSLAPQLDLEHSEASHS